MVITSTFQGSGLGESSGEFHPIARECRSQRARSTPGRNTRRLNNHRPTYGSANCGAQDTFYVGKLKGVDRVYQQTFVDTYSKVAFAKLYEQKTPITAADLLNDRVLPFFEEPAIRVIRVLTDRGTHYCGDAQKHQYELYLAIEEIDHTRTKARSPQANGIVERLHKTMLNESTESPSVRTSTGRSRSYRPTWTHGRDSTTQNARIKDVGATARRRCGRFSIVLT